MFKKINTIGFFRTLIWMNTRTMISAKYIFQFSVILLASTTCSNAADVSTVLTPLNVLPGQPWTLQCVVRMDGSDVYNGVYVYRKSEGATVFEPIATSTVSENTFISKLDLLLRATVTWNPDDGTITLSVNSFHSSDRGVYRCSLFVKDNPIPISQDKEFPSGNIITEVPQPTTVATTTTPNATTTPVTTATTTTTTTSTTPTTSPTSSTTTSTLSPATTTYNIGYSTEKKDWAFLLWLIPLLVILLLLLLLCLWYLLCFRQREKKKVEPIQTEIDKQGSKPTQIDLDQHVSKHATIQSNITLHTWYVEASWEKDKGKYLQNGFLAHAPRRLKPTRHTQPTSEPIVKDALLIGLTSGQERQPEDSEDLENQKTSLTPRQLKPFNPVETASHPVIQEALLIGLTSGQERQPEDRGDNQKVEVKPKNRGFVKLDGLNNGDIRETKETSTECDGIIISTLNGPYLAIDHMTTTNGTRDKESRKGHKKNKKHKRRK